MTYDEIDDVTDNVTTRRRQDLAFSYAEINNVGILIRVD
jgi:hypothetical protein